MTQTLESIRTLSVEASWSAQSGQTRCTQSQHEMWRNPSPSAGQHAQIEPLIGIFMHSMVLVAKLLRRQAFLQRLGLGRRPILVRSADE